MSVLVCCGKYFGDSTEFSANFLIFWGEGIMVIKGVDGGRLMQVPSPLQLESMLQKK